MKNVQNRFNGCEYFHIEKPTDWQEFDEQINIQYSTKSFASGVCVFVKVVNTAS